MLIWIGGIALARTVWATEPHRGAEVHSEPTFCMKTWSTAICTISTISIIGGLILLVFIIVGGWRIRSWLRERKLNMTLRDPDSKGYIGDAPSTPRYSNGPAPFKAPSRPSSVISVLKRSGKGQTEPYTGGSPCSTRPLMVSATHSPVSQSPPQPAPPPVAYHLPRRAMMPAQATQVPLQYSSEEQVTQQPSYQTQPRPGFNGSSNFQIAWPATGQPVAQSYAHTEQQQHNIPPGVYQQSPAATYPTAPPDHISGYPDQALQQNRPALSHYSSVPTHSSTSSASSYTVSTPSPTPTFSIPVSPAVQRVRAKSMIRPAANPPNVKRMTYHASTEQHASVMPPPLPPIQTSGLDPRGAPRKSLQRKSAPRARSVQSSGAIIPSPDDAARIGPSWHRNKMRQLQ